MALLKKDSCFLKLLEAAPSDLADGVFKNTRHKSTATFLRFNNYNSSKTLLN